MNPRTQMLYPIQMAVRQLGTKVVRAFEGAGGSSSPRMFCSGGPAAKVSNRATGSSAGVQSKESMNPLWVQFAAAMVSSSIAVGYIMYSRSMFRLQLLEDLNSEVEVEKKKVEEMEVLCEVLREFV